MLFKMKLFATNKNIGKKTPKNKIGICFFLFAVFDKKKTKKNIWENPAVKSQFIKLFTFCLGTVSLFFIGKSSIKYSHKKEFLRMTNIVATEKKTVVCSEVMSVRYQLDIYDNMKNYDW